MKKFDIPNNADAEAAVLSAVFQDNELIVDLGDALSPDDFYRQSNRQVYAMMRQMASEHKPIDLVTLTSRLKEAGHLEKIGGITYVTKIANASPTAANVMYHADLVADCAKRRKLIEIALEAQQRASEGTDDTNVVLDDMQQKITETMLRSKAGDIESTKDLVMSVEDWFDHRISLGENTGVPSGFGDIDAITHGWQPGDLIVLAARPSMGKTALAVNFGVNACKKGKAVLIFSLEMSKPQLVSRIIASEQCIDLSSIMNPSALTESEHGRRLDCLNEIYEHWHLHIDETAGITSAELGAKARRYKSRYGLDMIIIDYLQLMAGNNARPGSAENRTQEISAITRALKQIAKTLDVPVIVLSQLSRAVDARADKHPMLSDLRESGSIEQDADIVMFIYRDDYYYSQTEHNYSDVQIAKNRNGALASVKLFFAKKFTKFASYSGRE